MNKITEYKLVEAGSHRILEVNVQNLIEEGYQPYGSMYGLASAGFSVFLQPMVKYEEKINVDTKQVL